MSEENVSTDDVRYKKMAGTVVVPMPGVAMKRGDLSEDDLEEHRARLKAEKAAEARRKDVMDGIVKELNRLHFITVINGQTKFCTIQDGNARQPVGFGTQSDFNARYAATCEWYKGSDGEPIPVPATDWWFHPERREHMGGVHTRPGPKGTVPHDSTIYNLWQGWPIKPQPGDWSKTAWFLKHVICAGDEDHYQWLLGWMAHCVQCPGDPAETAVTLRGGRGTGKGTFAYMFGSFFGRNYLHLSNPVHLTGRFNAHLLGKLSIFLDEAFWAGDVKHEGVLKSLITEPLIPIEAKYVDVINVENVAKIIMASNDRWVVPAAGDERRYFMLEVSDIKKQDTAYFRELREAWNSGEQAALLHHLLAMDISEFDHRNPPHTLALNEQKIASFDPFDAWWYEKLLEGRIGDYGTWPELVHGKDLHKDYVAFAKEHPRGRYRDTAQALIQYGLGGKEGVLPGGIRKRKVTITGSRRVEMVVLPELAECRARFAELKRIPLKELFPDAESEAGQAGQRSDG